MVNLGTVRFKGRCAKHPLFDPLNGPAAIRGECRKCQLLLEIHQAHTRLAELIRKARNESRPELVKRAAASDSRQTSLF